MSDFEQFYRTRYESAATPPSPKPIKADAISQARSVSEDDLRHDPEFIRNAWGWYNATKHYSESRPKLTHYEGLANSPQGMEPITTNEQVADWAISSAAYFNNNLTKMAIDWHQMSKQPVGDIAAMMNVIEAYDQTPTTGKQVARGGVAMATDPLSWVGVSLLAGSAVKGVTKPAIKGRLREMLSKSLNNPIKVGAAEGAAYAGAMGAATEDLESLSQQRDFNAVTPLMYAGMGAAMGAGLGSGAKGVGLLWQKFKGYRGGGDGATFTDSQAVAAEYGDVIEKEFEANAPLLLDSPTITLDELADRLSLDESQTKALGDNRRDEIETARLMENESIQSLLDERGVDLVAYPESLDGAAPDTQEWAKDVESSETSLDMTGQSITYRQIREVMQ